MNRVSPADLFNLADKTSTTILTANNRLCAQLLNSYHTRKAASGAQVWPQPLIVPFSAWVRRQLQQLRPEVSFLSVIQERRLWEEVLLADPQVRQQHIQSAPTARLLYEAHQLLEHYQAPPFSPFTQEHKVFLRWRERWLERLAEGGWHDSNRMEQLLAMALEREPSAAPATLVMAGFDDLRPDQRQLLRVLENCGVDLCRLEPELFGGCSNSRFACPTRDQEVRAAARWIRQQLAGGMTSIGVVVPELSEYQTLIERIFPAELAPAGQLDTTTQEATFSLSLGSPLAREGVVASGLLALGLSWEVDFHVLSRLLRSPFIGGSESEAGLRSSLERRLRETRQMSWTLEQLAHWSEGLPAGRRLSHTRFYRNVRRLLRSGHHRRRLLPGRWAEIFADQLNGFGWPGERTLDSRSWQAVDKFSEVLGRLATLDAVCGELSRSEALSQLQRLVADEIFQVEAPEGPVQVVGLLESAGLRFDGLWLLGMHEAAFPSAPRPNPFLPLDLQKRLNMPHADASRELDYCRALAGRLFKAAPTVVASYPLQHGDTHVSPSPFIRDWQEYDGLLPASVDPRSTILAQAPPLERLIDVRGPALYSRRTISGGTALLKDQALCPFRAFAHHRLRAAGLDSPDVGIDPLSRGHLVHGLLEQFMKTVPTQEELLALTEGQARAQLKLAAESSLRSYEARQRRECPARLRILEAERLIALGLEWLGVERARSSYAVCIEQLEQRRTVNIGPLQISTRVDRVDRLANGASVVIDYKTGRPDPLQWFDERLSEPQLPLYALDIPVDQLGGVLFAQVRRGDCRFRGLVASPDDFPGLPDRATRQRLLELGRENLAPTVEHWRETLVGLAEDFASGAADVDPVDPVKVCPSCDLSSLCRIAELSWVASKEGVDD